MHRILSLVLLTMLFGLTTASGGEIHDAIDAGDINRVAELILTRPELVNERRDNAARDLPLHTAGLNGSVEVIRMLLDAGAEIDDGDADNSTALHNACIRKHRDAAALLIERGADVNKRDSNCAYALSFAASGGDTAVVRLVLESGADLFHRSNLGVALTHYAALRGLGDLMDRLIANGEDVNVRTASGMTPLMYASHADNVSMVEKLLSHGARVNQGNEHDETALHVAARTGLLDVGRTLIAWGADVNKAQSSWQGTPLFYTLWDGQTDFARMLIAAGADVNHSADGDLALYNAIQYGHAEMVEVLLEGGADSAQIEGDLGCTALHAAALRGYADVARTLLSSNAPLEVKNTAGDTPMELAVRYGNFNVAQVLKDHGAHGTIPKNKQGLATAANLPDGEAVIWFLSHSGWAVKTKNHLMVFDYHVRNRLPDQPSLDNGFINPGELKDEDVLVFASHVHGDHYDPCIWEWSDQIPNCTYVMGFEPEGDDLPSYEFLGARQTRTIDGVKITTIECNDSGVGFLVEVDGVTLLHPGDHANRQRDFSGPYQAEIDWLAQKNIRPDVAFFPISGCGFGDQVAVKMGVHYALETLSPRVFMPMHAGDCTNRYATFIEECQKDYPDIRMEAQVMRGDRYHYRNGRLAELAGRIK
jgi:ankyrin repeat protein/L-ascorbate metabolism protein UlaG (beta-lactamase superfamily)